MSHTHSFEENDWPFDDPIDRVTFTTRFVAKEGYPIVLVTHDDDGDWQFLCGTTNEGDDIVISCFGCIYERHPFIKEFADLPKGWLAWREDENSPWYREPQELENG